MGCVQGRLVRGRGAHFGLVLVDRYKLLRIMGSGGMGYVYLARHIAIDKFLVVA